jgi:hypothetical protein
VNVVAAIATSLLRPAATCRPVGRSTYCTRVLPSLAAPRLSFAWRLRNFATNRHDNAG